MVDVDIHTIWQIWGDGGLIDKIGPERTIRELKRRCGAGAIIGCSMYKLLIDKWMDVALRAGSVDPVTKERSDPGERMASIQFMQAAGEDELVNKIEALHTQYPDGIPRSVQLDLRDEWNDQFQKKAGRRIPLNPKEASKKDIEESKKIAAGLSEAAVVPITQPAPAAPTQAPKREEVKAVPAPVPVPVRAQAAPAVPAPPAAPPTPITEIPDKLELMKAEIRKRAEEERRRRMGGGAVAGEQPSKFETAKRIVSTMTAPGTESEENLEISPVFIRCPGRPGFTMCPGCTFKYTVTSASQCPYRDEFRGTIGEGDIKKIVGLVVRETGEPETTLSKSFLEYLKRVEKVKDMDSLTDLREYYDNVDTITVMTEYDKLQLKQFIIQRMQDILNDYEKSKPAFPEQFRETGANDKREGDTMTEPGDYTQWTFADFEALIASLEDIEDLEELYEYIDASDRLSDLDRITLRNLVKTRIDELAAGYTELSRIRG